MYAVSLLLLSVFFGCSKDEQPPAAPQQSNVQPAKPAAQALPPEQKELSTETRAGGNLDFSRRTDPFKPFAPVEAAPPRSALPDARSSSDLLPIQTFEVSKFRVAGIIAGLNENRALLIDPTGKGYVVRVGMLIGSNDGRITRITASSVEVLESFREDSGRIKKRKIVLTLTKKR